MAKKRNSIGRSLDRIQRAAQGKSSPLSKDAATDGVRTVFRLTNFEVTWDVMPDRELEALPQATRDRMAELYEMMNERPHSFIAELRELSTKHPGVSCLRNWFINALRCGSPSERAEARTVSEWLFHDRPDYFFARTMLAELCLEAGELGKAADLVFGENTALTTLYPERTVFHISEIRH